MRGRTSSKTETHPNKKVDKEETHQTHHLSGTYIRSLVKQLTSTTTSRTKEKGFIMVNQPKNHDQTLSRNGQVLSDTNQTHPPQPHKKQVRRRLHTSRPYQERLLNMAEARREIVAALKFHRATMKQQEAEKQKVVQNLPTPQLPSSLDHQQDEKIVKSKRNSRIYPSNNGAQSFQGNLSYTCLSNFPPQPTHLSSCPFPWNNSTMDACPENFLDFSLPNQPLGLSLNFHDFSSLEGTSLFHQPAAATEEILDGGSCSYPVMNEEVMAEIRSIGEQHQMAWDDTMNLVTSAWWFKFLKNMEADNQEVKIDDNNDVYQYHPFDQFMEFPSWINANETCFLQPLSGYCSKENLHEPPLPCMDIGEIEAMDEEWLS